MDKTLIFDLDGTLYEPIPEVSQILYDYWIEQLMNKFSWTREEAKQEHKKLREQYHSATIGMKHLGFGTTKEILQKAEQGYMDALVDNLQVDEKLIALIAKLRKQYCVVILSNTTIPAMKQKLGAIGLNEMSVDGLFSSADVGVTKPDTKPYEQILEYYNIEGSSCTAIGDRALVDLTPAKKMGMKTILVTWGKDLKTQEKSVVDETASTIYDVEHLLL